MFFVWSSLPFCFKFQNDSLYLSFCSFAMRNPCAKACSDFLTQWELILWFTLSTSTLMTLPLFQICTIKLHVNILLTGLDVSRCAFQWCRKLDWRGDSGSKTFSVPFGHDDTIELQRLCTTVYWTPDLTHLPSMVSLNEPQFMESQAPGYREDVEPPYISILKRDGTFWEVLAL